MRSKDSWKEEFIRNLLDIRWNEWLILIGGMAVGLAMLIWSTLKLYGHI